MNSFIVGGDFEPAKESSVIKKIAAELGSITLNGGSVSDIEQASTNLQAYDLVVWAPNISNAIEKVYPKKAPGAVLICTKVMREDRDFGDAVARVFKMNANAVIAIESREKPFVFTLLDALGNVWCKTGDIKELVQQIKALYAWTKASLRTNSTNVEFAPEELYPVELTDLCQVVKDVAEKVENERGGRYFGNVSTRCSKMFPSYRLEHDIILMSGRNVSKSRISAEDFVYTKMVDGNILYHGDRKPSVDTPIQLNMYEHYKNINFIIHGHAYIDGADFTSHYYPCGDLRELAVVKDKISNQDNIIVLNLKNHGFVIGADTLENLSQIVQTSNFQYRKIGEEKAELSDKTLETTH